MSVHSFPVPFREFNKITNAIPKELIQLVRSHLSYNEVTKALPMLTLEGIKLTDKKCNNRNIRQCFYRKNCVVPRGKFYWRAQIDNINWRRAWLLPHMYCVSNIAKEVHFKILHNIYPLNCIIAKFTDVSDSCSFCKKNIYFLVVTYPKNVGVTLNLTFSVRLILYAH